MISWQTYYRPHKFNDLHLRDVRERMSQFALTGTLPQVLLFTGPKGTGKTSTARIIAGVLNSKINEGAIEQYYFQKKSSIKDLSLQDPDLQDPEVVKILQGSSFCVVEIDAASHRGIDDVRALQDQVYLPPTMGKVMVYILDEVHMFTTEAFNALLKILEEPPKHAFFILATTESHKIPATVVSRCQVVNFRRATESELVDSFQKILSLEKITVESNVLTQIALLADGSFRDGVKFLQTVSNVGKINIANVEKLLIGDQHQAVEKLIDLILQKDKSKLIAFFAEARSLNLDEKFFVKNFFAYLYQQLTFNIKKEIELKLTESQAQFLLEKLLSSQTGLAIPFIDLELKILDIFNKSKKK